MGLKDIVVTSCGWGTHPIGHTDIGALICGSYSGGSSYYAAPAPPPTPGRGMPQTKKLSPCWKKFFSRWAAPDVVHNFTIVDSAPFWMASAGMAGRSEEHTSELQSLMHSS